jgi:hypothetical protein
MEAPIEPTQTKSNSNRNIIIGVVVFIILCCCCAMTAIAGYYGYKAYLAAQSTYEDLQDFEIPTMVPFNPSDPNSPTLPIPNLDSSAVPQGGLTDDSTRVVAWSTVQIFASLKGCTTPTVDGTTISVTQEPDSDGIWMEEWSVNCGDGTTQPFDLTFTPENGIVNVSIEFK